MRSFRLWFSLVGALGVGVVSTLVVQRVRAAGAPALGAITYTGQLELPDGTPVDGEKPIGLAVYDANGAKVSACDVVSGPVPVVRGRFQIALPDACAAAMHATPDLAVEIAVEGLPLGRTALGAVPYALEATHAVRSDEAASVKAGSVTVETAGCTFATNVTDCKCAAGGIAIAGGTCSGKQCGGTLVESRPVNATTWRVACEDATGARVQCRADLTSVVCLKAQ
ncbi:MAG: hypothetical protein ACOY0T_14650 [Myxococcota bacterium]